MSEFRRRLMMQVGNGFRKIEYLESLSGKRNAINTLISGGSNAEYELTAMIIPNNARYAHLYDSGTAPKLYLQAAPTTWSVQWSARVNITLNLNTKYKLSFIDGKYYVDDTQVAEPGVLGFGDTNFTLFSTSSVDRGLNGRIYYCKIYKDGVLVRDLIPVRQNSVGYMFDKVSETLFASVTGNPFGLGPDV